MESKDFRTELSLPAGSLQCALRAFDGGADSVYLGMKSFSARKGAVNFSFEDLRKLKNVCVEKNKKFYITLNTLVTDAMMSEVEKLLRQLDYLAPDGIIVQDLGIASLIREKHPTLPLHASTQLAVHTVEGVRELKELGFVRVVLARELALEEIKTIRAACPDIELKAFIHGAMCFGFSGLCMASEVLTGRSANCGECSQICRSWFSCDNYSEKFYPFSMKDMCVGHGAFELQKIGVDSLKIEGRMKGPDYVYHCARYYRMILDGVPEDNPDLLAEEEAMKTSFSRICSPGFLYTDKNLTCPNWPTHIGIETGIIQKVMKNKAVIRFTRPAALRDGLLVLSRGQSAGFALSGIENGRSFVSAGQTVTVDFPSSAFDRPPQQGTVVMCTSRHNANLPLLNENIPLFRKETDIDVTIEDDKIVINNKAWPVSIQQSKSETDICQILEKTFKASGESLFTCGKLSLTNKASVSSPFIPLSQLKQIRREFYAQLDAAFEEHCNEETAFASVEIPEIYSSDSSVCHLEPLMFNEKEYFETLDRLLEEKPNTLFGLNNIAQLRWAEKHPEARVFADFFLYVKNTEAWKLLNSRAHMEGRLSHMEKKDIPLFISRVCMRQSSLGLSCNNCSRNNTFTLRQNGKKFKVICRDCTTKVFIAD